MSSTGPLVQKLKDGIQDAVVFLRTLEQFKIPAVVQRRAKNLLEKLEGLQGDSIRDTPPRFEEPGEEAAKEEKAPAKAQPKAKPGEEAAKAEPKAKAVENSVKSKAVGATPKAVEKVTVENAPQDENTLKKRESKSIFSRVKELEEIDRAAKEAQKAYEDFKYGPKQPETKEDEAVQAEAPQVEETPVPVREKDVLKPPASAERPVSSGSLDSAGNEEEEDRGREGAKKDEKGKKKRGFKLFKKNRDKSPAPQSFEKEDAPPTEAAPAKEEEEKEEEATDDGKLPAQLERRAKRFGAHHWSKQKVSLDGTTLVIVGDKNKEERMELVGCTVGAMDIANVFEVVNHPEHKQLVFRAETPEAQKLWISALQEAMEECAATLEPAQTLPEDKEIKEEVPKITVESTEVPPEDDSPDQTKKRKESKAVTSSKASKKQRSEIPEHGVEMKGFVQRKVGWGKWEKSWCVVTYNAMYFTSTEENRDYSHFVPIMPDSKKSVQQKKGQGSHPGLIVKVGSKKEHISFESSSEASQWLEKLDQVMGLSGVEELASEDEEDEEEPGIDEELYEEVDNPPAVPASPRPAHRIPSIPEAEDFQDMAGEDIYEEFDDPPPSSLSASLPPALPPNHPTAQPDEPPPSLPPRPSPSLPPRGIPVKPKPPVQAYEIASPKVTVPPSSLPLPTEDDELYDDIEVPKDVQEVEEEYDDITSPVVDEVEEAYDDVVTTSSLTPEMYEDMAPAPATKDGPYVIMAPGQEEDEDGELYCEVDEPPLHTGTLLGSLKGDAKSPSKGDKSSTFSRVFNKGKSSSSSTSTAKGSHSGHLAHCPPGKTKSKDQWCVVDGNQIQLFKNASDKRPQDKLVLADCDLEVVTGGVEAGQFAFRLMKGGKGHTFTAKSKEELESWIGAVKGLVKSAILALQQTEQGVYQATEDHIAEDDSQLTFKKGTYIKLVGMDNEDVWTGQLGNEAQIFAGKVGQFPANKVEIAEDLYI